MGKFPASLLSIVIQLYFIETIFADEQVRKVQEALYKRHLFYGDQNGEVTPALTHAVIRYQKLKGFHRTGRLDSETCASLGVTIVPVESASSATPFALADNGDLRGANGEALPNSGVTSAASNEFGSELPAAEQTEGALTAANDDVEPSTRERPASSPRSRVRSRRIQPRKETNPLVAAFRSIDHAIRILVGDPQPKKKRVIPSRL